jgi:hypothetical protein
MTAHLSDQSGDRYTGVVVIHGLGTQKRSETLQEAVNALAYWFNHEAGFALRQEGPGRVWVRAHLTDDPNPDAPAARATMELSAPGEPLGKGDAALRLEFREVWWAESFGLASSGDTLRWTRVQFREQAANLLLLFGGRLGPAAVAARTPAREIPQALTYRPSNTDADTHVSGAGTAHPPLTRPARTLLRGALGPYGLLQYVWKALQWIALAPLVFLLLLLMGLIRLLALIPAFQSTVVATLSAVLQRIMLHWIAEARIYTLDYTRSAGIRERFEREVQDFLGDDACDRVVVIAHSMGTVIAYEGLTTLLSAPNGHARQKPVTFVCLAQALRRVWLMTADDPHRLRGVLPDDVRWLHFWARYDPVACGPLSARSLPRVDPWPDPAVADPQDALCARLDRCENIAIVNTDSTFTDHTTYYQNLEQVVGPVAAELVAGHSDLERLVREHLATADDVLRRRWRVAWRTSIAILGGLGAGTALFLWDWLFNAPAFGFGRALSNSLPAFIASQIINTPAGWVLNLMEWVAQTLGQVGLGVGGLPASWAPVTYSALAAFALAGLAILGLGQLLAGPPALAFERPIARLNEGNARAIIALSTLCLALLDLSSLVLASYHGDCNGLCSPSGLRPSAYMPGFLSSGAAFVWILNLGFAVGIAAVGMTLVSAARHRHQAWYVPVLLLFVPMVTVAALKLPAVHDLGEGFRSISQNAAAVGAVGCVFVAVDAIRRFQWGRVVGILPVTLLLLVGIYQFGLTSVNVLPTTLPTYLNFVASIYQGLYWASPAMATVIYGLWISRGGDAGATLPRQSLLRVWAAVLVGQIAAVVLLITPAYGSADQNAVYEAALWGVGGLIAIAFVASVVVAIREGQWGWALVMVLYLVLQETVIPGRPDFVAYWPFVVNWQLALQGALLGVALPIGLCYVLWVPSGRAKPVQESRESTAPREAVDALRGVVVKASGE